MNHDFDRLVFEPDELDLLKPWTWPHELVTEIVLNWRLAAELSQTDAGELIGKSRWTFWNIEHMRHRPQKDTLGAIRNAVPDIFDPCAECGKIHPGGAWARSYHESLKAKTA